MDKICEVVLIPSNEKTIVAGGLYLHAGPSALGEVTLIQAKGTTALLDKQLNEEAVTKGWYTSQHLYIISNDKIAKGDYVLAAGATDDGGPLSVVPYTKDLLGVGPKIIATTDSSLFPKETNKRIGWYPQIPQSFVDKYAEEYNKGNVITHVLVEYEGVVKSTTWEYEEPEEYRVRVVDGVVCINNYFY